MSTILPSGLTPENEIKRQQMLDRVRLQHVLEDDLRAERPGMPDHWYEKRASRLLQLQAQNEREAELHRARLRQFGS